MEGGNGTPTYANWGPFLRYKKVLTAPKSHIPAVAGSEPDNFVSRLNSLRGPQAIKLDFDDDPHRTYARTKTYFNHLTISRDETRGSEHSIQKLAIIRQPLHRVQAKTAAEFGAGLANLNSHYEKSLNSSGLDQKLHSAPAQGMLSPDFESDSSSSFNLMSSLQTRPPISSRTPPPPTASPPRPVPLLPLSTNRHTQKYSRGNEEQLSDRQSLRSVYTTSYSHHSDTIKIPSAGGPWLNLYQVHGTLYFDEPDWRHDELDKSHLHKKIPFRGLEPLKWEWNRYRAVYPEIDFVIIRKYSLSDSPNRFDNVHSERHETPKSSFHSIILSSQTMLQAMVKLSKNIPNFGLAFPDFGVQHEVDNLPLFLLYFRKQLPEFLCQLDITQQEKVKVLFDFLGQNFSGMCRDIETRLDARRILASDIPYLFLPGELVVNPGTPVRAFIVRSTPTFSGSFKSKPDETHIIKQRETSQRQKLEHGSAIAPENEKEYDIWSVSAWRLDFDRGLSKMHETLQVKIEAEGLTEVKRLSLYPSEDTSNEIKSHLKRRGQRFWKCLDRCFVSLSDNNEEINGDFDRSNERFMVDFAMYNELHPKIRDWRDYDNPDSENSLSLDITDRKNPPQNGLIYLFPSTIVAYNIRLKKWTNIEVDNIRDVKWDKEAFKNLVIEQDIKHLLQCLVSTRISQGKSTDLIQGKGGGLIVLLHGGPGTGKTFTAESIAEMAEKPLYRVTCGDIGTTAVDVEKYLEAVLHLGKVWDCVVLLDEADVFLEERGLNDLHRNALVSVFLRVLEYYDGILFLTSNRVGTFDQAFKSRIHLALHYEDFKKPQRRKVWRNFFNRLKEIDQTNVDHDDLVDNIDLLAEEELNGRQIRNSISIGRQLAQFDGKQFGYDQLKQVIKISAKFDGYLKGVFHGLSQEDMARDASLR